MCARERVGRSVMMGRFVEARDKEILGSVARTISGNSQIQDRNFISLLSFSRALPTLSPSLARSVALSRARTLPPHTTFKRSHLNILLMSALAVGEIALGLEM